MAKKIIHVNRQFIAFNARYGKPVLPCYIVREGSKPSIYGFGIKCKSGFELVDPRFRKQLKCGARSWIETDGEVEITEPMSFQKADALRKKYDSELKSL